MGAAYYSCYVLLVKSMHFHYNYYCSAIFYYSDASECS